METPTIRIIDFDVAGEFQHSLATTTAVVRGLNDWDHYSGGNGVDYWREIPSAHVERISTASDRIFLAALVEPALVLQIASHVVGWGRDAEPAFQGPRGDVGLHEVARNLSALGLGVTASCVFVDGCDSGRRMFVKAFRQCLSAPIVFIGTTRSIYESDSVKFTAPFYGHLLRNRGKGRDPLDRALEAAGVAMRSYELTSGAKCPYRAEVLTPSPRKPET